ncbi:MAG: 2-oxo-4-hydroxy-4-carboxy-5-ureidoimidazoline decarboxylase [Scytonematopsis contorta HA4267-MV1]|jgi:2-oxo-4-hydroxy-4-carboxy-5-ureidoimidazoline decarboxylase|nr:2-oxo-4-hydroxy-4-carboxy-5-ureidoimidazoline decarboxylase [Scytonematopsis contorta HA4267-MV1]
MIYSIAQVNQMSQDEFVATVGFVFEQTPQIAHQAWIQRPFASVMDLHEKMVAVVNAMSKAEQLALIQAHPDLGSKAKMAEASVKEQRGAGLNELSQEEYERFHQLNQEYKNKFGFPFIIAVKNHNKSSILEAFELRLRNQKEAEIQKAIVEITEIAKFRLLDLSNVNS